MLIRTITFALLLMVNSGALLTAFYGRSPIGRHKTWQEMTHIDRWDVQLFYVLYALWFVWPVFKMLWDQVNPNSYRRVVERSEAAWHKKYGGE